LWASQRLEIYSQQFRQKGQMEKARLLVTTAGALLESRSETDSQQQLALASFRARQGDFAGAFALLPAEAADVDPRQIANITAAFVTSCKATDQDLARLQT